MAGLSPVSALESACGRLVALCVWAADFILDFDQESDSESGVGSFAGPYYAGWPGFLGFEGAVERG
jgi:hypothetical protein